MIADIQTKLEQPLSTRIRREETVVYVLVQVYKLLESEGRIEVSKYRVIKFFRNWAVHSVMNRDDADAVLNNLSNPSTRRRYLSLETLRSRLYDFLNEREMPTFLVEEGWFQFSRLLVSVLCDQPITRGSSASTATTTTLDTISLVRLPDEHAKSFIKYTYKTSDGLEKSESVMIGDYDAVAKRAAKLSNAEWKVTRENKRLDLLEGQLGAEGKSEELEREILECKAVIRDLSKIIERLKPLVVQDRLDDKNLS